MTLRQFLLMNAHSCAWPKVRKRFRGEDGRVWNRRDIAVGARDREDGFQPAADDPSARVEGRSVGNRSGLGYMRALTSGSKILVNRGTYSPPLGGFTSISSAISWKATTPTLGQGRAGA